MNINKLLNKNIDPKSKLLIKKAGALADSMGVNAYLVGGMVRDVLLGLKPGRDIDLTVEGDGLAFAKSFADDLDASYKGFEKFRTARIFLKSGQRIDVASARSEKYPEPGMLPQVELAAINQDLYRRDFTVNAMAVRVNKQGFGELLDPFNGIKDMETGTLRVLHDKSFIDDPTRMLRFIRFQSRFGFMADAHTCALFKSGLTANTFDTVSGERLREEVMLLLKEKQAYKALKELETSGALTALAKGVVFNKGLKKLLENIGVDEKDITMLGVDPAILKLAAFLSRSPDKAVMKFLDRMKFSNNRYKAVLQIRQSVKLYTKLSKKVLSGGGIYRILKGFGAETLLYLMSAPGNIIIKRNVRNYLNGLCAAKPAVTGKDLKKMGIKEGPFYRKILDKLQAARFDGKLETKADEIRFIRKYLI